MGRRPTPLSKEALEPTLGYIRRALDRQAPVFAKPHRLVAVAFASLTAKADASKVADYVRMVDAWIAAYMSTEGRAAMLAALRRRKADAATAGRPSRVVRLQASTYAELQGLATELDMPLATALTALVRAGLTDVHLQATLRKLATP